MIPTIRSKKLKKLKSQEFKKKVNFEKLKIMWEVFYGAIALIIAPNPNPEIIHQISYL